MHLSGDSCPTETALQSKLLRDLHFSDLACNPASPACCDPALPIHITSHRTEFTGSSTTSSTSCPRLSLKLPFQSKPLLRPIDNKTGKHSLDSIEIDDKAASQNYKDGEIVSGILNTLGKKFSNRNDLGRQFKSNRVRRCRGIRRALKGDVLLWGFRWLQI